MKFKWNAFILRR